MTTTARHDLRAGFWDRGGFWKAALLAVLYVGLNLLVGRVLGALAGGSLDDGGPLASLRNVLLELVVPLVVSTVAVLGLVAALGWWRPLFGPQPELSRRWWMWLPPALILLWNGLSFAAVDTGAYAAGVVGTVVVLGLLIGVAEEVLARGLMVGLLRRAGYREVWVAVLSSLLFALMHLLSAWGGGPAAAAVLVGYTFCFGLCMYFTLRVTRNLVWPILLHATTDPATLLRVGGIDGAGVAASSSALGGIAGLGNFVVIALGLVLVWCVRGKVAPPADMP
jgi:membrane protease YdiL (CAAX protease family)